MSGTLPVAWREGGPYRCGLLETPPIPIELDHSRILEVPPKHRVL